MNKIKQFFAKLKKIKHIEIWLALLIGILVCVSYFGVLSAKNDKKTDDLNDQVTSTVEYVDKLENKLCNVIAKIDGVKNVDVAITLDGGFSYEYATDTETKTTISGGVETTIKTETVIMVSNQPLVLKEIYPVIKGVVVVADGAENFAVKMKILSAIETVLEIDTERITILN